jgi:3-hydroxyisobutyrate dehydrogenase-like beta-hydroxyacid dehydrogenase
MKIGFIGLGKMGAGMARNLLRAGHEVRAYNRSRAKVQALAADGIQFADTIAAACHDSEAVITMVADDHALEAVIFGEAGLAASLASGATHISSSTIGTALSRRLTAEHAARGQGYLSATVFGRPEAAEARQLVVVAGGPANLTDRFRPLFDAIGRQVFIAGVEPWQANAVKLCGNFMIASMLETFSEAFATLRKAKVDPHLFLDTMTALFGSPVYASYGRIIADEKFDPAGFPVPLGLKDVKLVLQTADECASPMPIASLVRDQLLSALAQGQSSLDWASVSKVAARNAGL